MLNKKALAAAVGVPAGYQIERSLRFNSADSAYLTRTPASAGNRKTWTWSGWVKLSSNKAQQLFTCVGSQSDTTSLFIDMLSGGNLRVLGWTTVFRSTSALYRDFSAWYHIVVAFDTTQATANDRIKVYVNGTQVTDFATTNNPTQNTDYGINQASLHEIGRYSISGTGYDYLNGYLTEVNFIDGQALTPSSFGETDADTGIWKPKAFSGTYGTNGFYLDFSDNSGTTSTTLGKDYSGNSNNFTPNNFSVTAGTGNDSLVDTPTPYGTDTGAGGEVRGNYCTLNPLDQAGTLANGNLYISTTSAAWTQARGTIGISSGKWYWETTCNGGTNWMTGIAKSTGGSTYVGVNADGWSYSGADSGSGTGSKYNNGSSTNYGLPYTTNDVIGVAFDADAGTITFYKNNSSQGQAFSGLTSGPYFPAVCVYASSGTSSWFVNFGQRPFAYTAPSGYKALVTQNLPTPTVIQGDDYFNTVLYTGTGATRSITGVGFAPDFVWNKGRSNAVDHCLNDIVRGANKQLVSNTTDAELTYTNQLTSFDSDGFSLGADNLGYTNYNNVTYVAWCWKGGGAGSSNTAGTITSTVSANTTSGCSIVTYTGTGANATVGHGLDAVPGMIIIKARGNAYNWAVWHTSLGGGDNALQLNNTNAKTTSFDYWNGDPSSTLFRLGADNGVNQSSATYVAYCFAPVAGFSAFGSYTGNGSTDGPFVYTGFRPAFILVRSTSGSRRWQLFDDARFPVNGPNMPTLTAEQSAAESTTTENAGDFLSNGFKCRATNGNWNGSGETYIYAAFADNPFKYSLAR